MGPCSWTTCPTSRGPRVSRPACSDSGPGSAPDSPTADCTPASERATSSCRSRTGATSRSSGRSTTRRSTGRRSDERSALAPTRAAAGSPGSCASTRSRPSSTGSSGRRRPGTDVVPTGSTCAGSRSASTTWPIDRQLPFFVHWDVPADEHPSAGGSRVRLRRLEIAGDEQRVDDYLGTPTRQPLDGVELDWVLAGRGRHRRGRSGVRDRVRRGPHRLSVRGERLARRAFGHGRVDDRPRRRAASTDPARISGKPIAIPRVTSLVEQQHAEQHGDRRVDVGDHRCARRADGGDQREEQHECERRADQRRASRPQPSCWPVSPDGRWNAA